MASRDDYGIISLQSSSRTVAFQCTKREGSAIINAVGHNVGYFDILTALNKLKDKITEPGKYLKLLERFSRTNALDKYQLLLFIFTLLELVPFSGLYGILYLIDFGCLAERIKSQLNGNACRDIGHAKLKKGSFLQRYFYGLKSVCDDNGFKSRRQDLDNISKAIVCSMRKFESQGAVKVQKAADKLAVITWLQVQQCEKSEDVRHLITIMERLTPPEADKTITKFVYESKSAVAFELDGDSDNADEHLRIATYLADIYSDPLTKALLIHDRRYVYQLRYMRRKTDDDRRKVQAECYKGLSFFFGSQGEFCTFMKRIMCLYTLHSLLKIGQNFEIDVQEEVSRNDIDNAESILRCLERCFQSGQRIEKRRKMIYLTLKARVHEFGGDCRTAEAFSSAAYNMMPEGTFFTVEKRNLENFKNRLSCT